MQQPLHAAAEIDERAELTDRGDPAGHHRAGDDRLADFVRGGALLFLEQGAPRDDDVPAPLLVFDDAELVDAPFVHRRIGPQRVDLGERTEGAQPRDPDLVSPFTAFSTFPSTGRRLWNASSSCCCGGGPARQPA